MFVRPDETPCPHEGIDLNDMHSLSSTLNLYDHIERAYANMSDMERPTADVVVAVLLTVGVEALCKRGANIEFFAASLFLRRDHAYRDPRASDRKLTDFQNRRARKRRWACSLLHGLWARSGMLPRSCSITIWITPGRGGFLRGTPGGIDVCTG